MAAGRQRTFDKQQALEQAMRVFWQKGFVGASLADLTQSMGINKPSMYAAFGNKEQLFIQATENYMAHYASGHARFLQADDQPMALRLKNFLLSAVAAQCGEHGPKGCYLSVCVSEAASLDFPDQAHATIEQMKNITEELLVGFFSQAQQKAEISQSANVRQLAAYYVTLLHGTAAMARAGKSLAALEQTIDLALQLIDEGD
ncbi:TetR/AcrR family transcriptional regulator [Marinicella sediminis]|uniref:TetR/AcrR family transcriptional regulator n=1 Tax=Marinicella sediminis TaxID=1792834 RepID=A0ABV7JDH6_9GAMM|nr:TetR/AcrR family transcriptional regulator [Marinicella sediminis]